MPEIDENEFTLYKFTDEEMLEASTFNDLQLKYLRTMRALTAIEKVNMAVSSGSSPEDYVRRQEHLRGALGAYDLLLTSHETLIAAKRENEREKAAASAPIVTASYTAAQEGIEVGGVYAGFNSDQ